MARKTMISAASAVIESPDLWERRLPASFSDLCPKLLETDKGCVWTAAGKVGSVLNYQDILSSPRSGNLSRQDVARLATPEGRIWLQNRDGVDAEVLYSVTDVWDLINASGNAEFITECYRAYNDWLAEVVDATEDRVVGIAKIPTTGIEQATSELKRAGEKLHFSGAVLDVWPAGAGTPPAAKKCESFWEAAAALNMPVSIYATLNGEKDPSPGIVEGKAPDFVHDVVAIIYANVFDRYPQLRLVSVAPNVGWAPHMFESMNDGYMRTAALRRFHLGDPDLLPSDYLRRFVWFTTQDDRTGLLNRAYFGSAHLMWGSFALMPDSVWPNSRGLFERVTAAIPGRECDLLAAEVVTRLYGVGNAKPFSKEETTKYLKYGLL